MLAPLAEPADLEGWCEPPDNVGPLLRSASLLVRRAARLSRYPVLDDGTPADERVAAALREATCAQVAAWTALDVDPSQGAVQPAEGEARASSVSIGGAAITYATASSATTAAAEQARVATAASLVPDAALILEAAGLLGGRVRAL